MLCDKGKTAFAKEMLSESHMPHNDKTRPDGGERPLTLMEMSDASLCPDVKALCRVPIASPPVHGEVSLSTTKQLSRRKAVNKDEETNTPKGLPIPLAALLLPKQTPISSLRAAPSRSLEDELKQHLLMVTG